MNEGAAMHLKDINEFALIDRLAGILGDERPGVVEGIGDDVAVLDLGGPDLLLATVDAQVAGVHYLPDRIPPGSLGRRLLAVNLSDIAAMGGEPRFALVSLALPEDTVVAWLEEVYRGLREEADRWGVAVVGGNVARTAGPAVLDLCLLGRVDRGRLLRRAGARPGDRLFVTGHLGEAAAGLRLLLGQAPDPGPEARQHLLGRLFTPTPRLREAALVAASGQATAMIDLSDGLAQDVGHLCDRSQVGVRVYLDRLPLSPETRQVAAALGLPAWQLALEGGEDYELCFCLRPEGAEAVAQAVQQATGTPVTEVGEVLPAEAGRIAVDEQGARRPLPAAGWRHFG